MSAQRAEGKGSSPRKTAKQMSIDSLTFKKYPGQQQVDMSVEVQVPGSWFGKTQAGGLNPSEKREKYKAVAVESNDRYVFEPADKKARKPARVGAAIRFICPEDAADNPNHEGFWMGLDQWNRYRHDTYKDRPEDEARFIPASEVVKVAAALAAAAAKDAPQGEGRKKPPVYEYFEFVKSGTHQKETKQGVVDVPAEWYQCKKKASGKCKCKVNTPDGLIKIVEKGTGPLLSHVKACEGVEVWLQVRCQSKGSRVSKGADGTIVEKFGREELMPHHARWVIYCFTNWDHFSKSRKKEFVEWLEGFEPRARMPHRNTCVKLMFIIKSMICARLYKLLSLIKQMIGSPFCGLLDDIWSKLNCKQSFSCARIPLAIDGDLLDRFLAEVGHGRATGQYSGKIISCSPILSFTTLPSSRHSGMIIARWKTEILAATSVLELKDISLAVEDGASNNKKSNKILKLPSKVCTPHDLQRCVLIAAGLAGKPCLNPELQKFQSKSNKMVGAFSKSGVATSGLFESQEKDDEVAHKLSLASPNATRWLGLHRQAQRNRLLKPNISEALCGDQQGKDDDFDDEGASAVVSDHGDSGSNASGDEDAAEVSSDDDRIETNVRRGANFPLEHRLLSNHDFELNCQWESVLATPAETSSILQAHDGTPLDEAHLLLTTAVEHAEGSRLQVVSGRFSSEQWTEQSAARLDPMLKTFRTEFADQGNTRFRIKGTPDEHTLLALKMSPFIDTTSNGKFGNRATQELMNAQYRSKLRSRLRHMKTGKPPAASVSSSASSSSPRTSSPASSLPAAPQASSSTPSAPQASSTTSSSNKRVKVSALSSKLFVKKEKESEPTSQTAEELEEKEIEKEIQTFEQLSSTVDVDEYYDPKKEKIDLNPFWANHRKALPIHYHVFLGDCGSKRAASASVETVYSGATKLSNSADRLGDSLLACYVFNHYNWKFEFLCPSVAEIVAEYKKVHGPSIEVEDSDNSEDEQPADKGNVGGEDDE